MFVIRYGDDAGQAADTAVQSAVSIGVTAFNVDNLGIKGVMKAAGKQTAKAMTKQKSEAEKCEMAEKQLGKVQKKESA